jgi:hypothetical protein
MAEKTRRTFFLCMTKTLVIPSSGRAQGDDQRKKLDSSIRTNQLSVGWR